MLALLLTALAAAPSMPPAQAAPTAANDLDAQTRAWHERRLKSLTSEDGWLTLVALQWLDEGDNQLQLPAPAPSPAGVLARKGKAVTFAPAKGVDVKLGEAAFAGGPLKTDEVGEPDVLQIGRLKLYLIQRGEKIGVRVKDPEAPARKQFKGIDRFPVSGSYRVEARFEPAAAPRKIPVPTVLGTVEQMTAPGTVSFEINGQKLQLTPVVEDGDDKLFFIFADETNKTATYGAGRFLYAPMPKDGKVVLDFNRATNPPCAFSHFATCPLPPRENRLATKIESGEKRYGDH